MDMDRPRLAVVLSACLLAALLLADGAVAAAAVREHPDWSIGEGVVQRHESPVMRTCGAGQPCPFGVQPEDWTYFALFVRASQGEVAQVDDTPMQGVPYALYAFDTSAVGSSHTIAGKPVRSWEVPTGPSALWNASLLRPSLVRIREPAHPGLFNGTERVGTAPPLAQAVRTGSDPGGGVVFVWANRTGDQATMETFGRLSFASVLSRGFQVTDPALAGLHPWLAAGEGLALLVLLAAAAWMVRARRDVPRPGPAPLTAGEEMLALLERSADYLRGMRNTATAGLVLLLLAGLLALGPMAGQVGAVGRLHGAAAAWLLAVGFAAVYAALALLWALQVGRVTRELRRLRVLRAAAGP